MRTVAAAPLWRASAGLGQLLCKEVEDGWLVYTPLSGETRLLSPLSQFLVELLQEQPLDSAALTAAVLEASPGEDPAQCAAAVEQTLDALGELGLVDRPMDRIA